MPKFEVSMQVPYDLVWKLKERIWTLNFNLKPSLYFKNTVDTWRGYCRGNVVAIMTLEVSHKYTHLNHKLSALKLKYYKFGSNFNT
jgi:hypothetical protein